MKTLLLIAILPVTVAAQCTSLAVDRQIEGLIEEQNRRLGEQDEDATPEIPELVVPTAADVIIACPSVEGEDVFALLESLARQRTEGVSAQVAKANLLLLEFDCDNGNDRQCIACVDTLIAFAFPGQGVPAQPAPITERPAAPDELPLDIAVACLAANQEQVPALLAGIFDARDDGVSRDATLQFLSISCGANAGCQRCVAEMVDVVFGNPDLDREALLPTEESASSKKS